jgi:hypothetical protein
MQYIGLHELPLTADELQLLQVLIDKYGLHACRHLTNSHVFVHIKGRPQDACCSKYSVRVRLIHNGNIIVASVHAWDVRAGVHKAFRVIENKLYSHPLDYKQRSKQLCAAV